METSNSERKQTAAPKDITDIVASTNRLAISKQNTDHAPLLARLFRLPKDTPLIHLLAPEVAPVALLWGSKDSPVDYPLGVQLQPRS